MRKRHIPILSSLVLAATFVGLWIYALRTTSNTPLWGQLLILLILVVESLVGLSAAITLKSSVLLRGVYISGVCLCLLGSASFFYYAHNTPTAINISGMLAIIAGLVISLIFATILATREEVGD